MKQVAISISDAERSIVEGLGQGTAKGNAGFLDFYSDLAHSREDLAIGGVRVHAVFEGSYPFHSESKPYRADSDEAMGMPVIEMLLPPDPVTGFEKISTSEYAATLLGLNGASTGIRKLAESGRGFEARGVSLTASETTELAEWIESACRPILDAHRDAAAFAVLMADRYDLLYETQDRLCSHMDQEKFELLLRGDGLDAIRAVAAARGDAITSDREASAFIQTLEGVARRLELLRDARESRPQSPLEELNGDALLAATATTRPSASSLERDPRVNKCTAR